MPKLQTSPLGSKTMRWLVLIPLILAMLACTLTADNTIDEATPIPTANNIGQVASITPTNQSMTATPTGGALRATPTGCPNPLNWTVYTVQRGDTLSSIAVAVNSSLAELIQVNCALDPDVIDIGDQIYVPNLPIPSTSTAAITCENNWFFTFRPGERPNQCPVSVMNVNAVGQNFEGGRVLWYQTSTLGWDADYVYVIYNDGSWNKYPDTWASGQAENDPSIVPPADRVQPVRGIGKVWRENEFVRGKLGWGFGPEEQFAGRLQEIQGTVHSDPGWELFIDHGRNGLVLRIVSRSAANGGSFWDVVGDY